MLDCKVRILIDLRPSWCLIGDVVTCLIVYNCGHLSIVNKGQSLYCFARFLANVLSYVLCLTLGNFILPVKEQETSYQTILLISIIYDDVNTEQKTQ